MKIFVDHCVVKDVAFALREAGWGVVRAHGVGMANASDDALFQYAVKEQCVLQHNGFDHRAEAYLPTAAAGSPTG